MADRSGNVCRVELPAAKFDHSPVKDWMSDGRIRAANPDPLFAIPMMFNIGDKVVVLVEDAGDIIAIDYIGHVKDELIQL